MDGSEEQSNRAHRKPRAGRGAEKKKNKTLPGDEKNDVPKLDPSKEAAKKRNPKAFAVHSAVSMRKMFNRSQDKKTSLPAPMVLLPESEEPPPIVVAIVGPPKVGKSTLMRSLIKHYSRQKMSSVDGPITVVSGKHRRITFIECPTDLNSMIDVAKVADLVLLMIDASYGFEMEIFEFLHIAQVHGLPRVMGVVTHLDCLPPGDKTNKVKKKLKHRFWTELYDGATLFCLSRLAKEGEYMNQEISNLARFISVIKFRPIMWRQTHSYVVADRLEDMTDPAQIEKEPKCDRNMAFYGFVRGANMNATNQVHIPGVGDFTPKDVVRLPDPCPLPKTIKKRSLNQKERLIYAPLTGHGGMLYDKDAVYLDTEVRQDEEREGDDLLEEMKNPELAEQEENVGLTLIRGGEAIERRVVPEKINQEGDAESDEDENMDEDESDEELEGPEEIASASEDEEEMEIDEEDENQIRQLQREIEGDGEDDEDASELNWKDGMHQTALDRYRERKSGQINLKQLVYGEATSELKKSSSERSEVGGLFVKIMEKGSELNNRDQTVPVLKSYLDDAEKMLERIEFLKDKIADCFVTGDWGDEDATRLLKEDDMFDDEELFGDFEDLEGGGDSAFESEGGAHEGSGEESNDESDDEMAASVKNPEDAEGDPEGDPVEEAKTAKQKAWEKKMKLKKAFNREYDDKGDPTASFYEQWKKEAEEVTNRNKQAFADLPDDVRVEFEGFRQGLYVRIEIENVPCELINNFEPKHPIIIGGLLPNEQKRGTLQLRVKRHRWFTRPVLKSRDPLIFSLGWRRFQSMPIYYMQDHNMRQRFLKYSPENMHCWAAMKAPVAPQGTGFLAIQKMEQKQPGFRLAATGTILHQDHSAKVVKKLKLVGYPLKTYKNTAFIRDMFTSQIEATKFEGAQVKTVSGVRGIIKKSLRSPEGAVRVTFEDKIIASDIVFLRTWAGLTIPDLYLPVTNILQPEGEKSEWRGMKTTAEIRKEKGIVLKQNQDSLYKPIERKKRIFNKLNIPKSLLSELPFQSQPKDQKARIEGVNKKRKIDKAVISEPGEAKVKKLLNILGHEKNARDQKRKEASKIRAENYRKELIFI